MLQITYLNASQNFDHQHSVIYFRVCHVSSCYHQNTFPLGEVHVQVSNTKHTIMVFASTIEKDIVTKH